tara:strand:- start:83 stop:331 length:249 start_codon:yes stop_codon:yes gene_type:complete
MSKKSIEKEYDELALKVNKLLDDAAKSIAEASALAQAKGLYVGWNSYDDSNDKQDMFREKVDNQSLFKALSEAGWSASSMEC